MKFEYAFAVQKIEIILVRLYTFVIFSFSFLYILTQQKEMIQRQMCWKKRLLYLSRKYTSLLHSCRESCVLNEELM